MKTRQRVLRAEHPSTLISMDNLAGDVQESRAMAGGGRAGRASDGDDEEGAGRGASQHADQHKQPGVYPEVLKTRY